MKISGFILVIDSYLVRLGVTAMLNRIRGTRVLKEFGAADPFEAYLENHHVDFIIIGQSVFDYRADLFMSKPELLEKTILLEEGKQEGIQSERQRQPVHASIHLMEGKESLVRKINILLDNQKEGSASTHSIDLSPRETTILKLVSMGFTNNEIADQLFLSAYTVMTHRKNITNKLGIKSVSGLTIYAIVNNIISIDDVSSLPAK